MNRNNNYFFQSEQEFLYNGSLTNARNNILAVTGTIFLIRFVFNYISTFVIGEIRTIILAIKKSLAWSGPFAIIGIVIAELARFGWALAESIVDVVALVNRQEVPLFKNHFKDWYLGGIGPEGPPIAKLLADIAKDITLDATSVELELKGITDAVDAIKDSEVAFMETPLANVNITADGLEIDLNLKLSYSNYMYVLLMFENSDRIAEEWRCSYL
jgi:hypothetical protein